MRVEPIATDSVESQPKISALQRCYFAFASVYAAVRVTAQQQSRGSLLLLTSPDSVAAGTAAAARIAGGATLLVTADTAEAKQSVRSGACDFLVSSLDEALRILKNEVRQARPIGVCLLSSPHDVLVECVERGVQPDLLDCAEAVLERRGAQRVSWQTALEDQMEWVAFQTRPGAQSQLMRATALAASGIAEPGALRQPERLHWLGNAPAVLGRSLHGVCCVPMSDRERLTFLRRLAAESLSGVERLE